MASLRDLPVELLSLVFGFIYSSSRKLPRHPELSYLSSDSDEEEPTPRRPQPIDPEDMIWDRSDEDCYASLFPYNVTWVCKMWRDILICVPAYWSRIIFDVADDPSPMLDAFLWSKALRISVFVFSSVDDAPEDEENCRTNSIISSLRPHIERCTSIVFDVQYASSLPSPTMIFTRKAIRLEELVLACSVDDLSYDLDNRRTTEMTTTTTAETNFPALHKLSLTGHAFMELQTLGRDWTSRLKAHPHCLAVYVSHFQFHKERAGVDNGNTFTNFMDLLTPIHQISSICLKNLSMAYRPRRRKLESRYNLNTSALYFDDVSSDFLAEFFRVVEGMPECVRLSHCSIPPITPSRPLDCWFLVLENIPGSTSSAIDDDSFYNILSAWSGSELTVLSCASFDDELLEWLVQQQDGDFPADKLMTLGVRDCPNFTADAMRRLVEMRSDKSKVKPDIVGGRTVLRELWVDGEGPTLQDEHTEWFIKNAKKTTVRWQEVDNADGTVISTFSTPWIVDEL
ncbi:hypothetical protein BDZ97DRAFT_2079566 [Flammula alnicola]|nr:hypothetical protein BDZ97DRAFT_2079566 [Flammula alnicola]